MFLNIKKSANKNRENIMKIISKRLSILAAIILLIGLTVCLWKTRLWHNVIRYQIEKTFFSQEEERLTFKKDIDTDGLEEKIRFMIRRFPSREYFREGFIVVEKDGKKEFQSNILGNELEMADIYDVNRDGRIEIVSKWAEGNARYLHIYSFGKSKFTELLWASGKDVRVFDVDNDGIEEIIEYWRDYDKSFNNFFANLYKWNKREYALWLQDIPIVLDPVNGDRLLLGRRKIAVLK